MQKGVKMTLKEGWTPLQTKREYITPKFADRKKKIAQMRKNGKSYEQIGHLFGVSRQRVHQILKGEK